jgi:hypothetical protein
MQRHWTLCLYTLVLMSDFRELPVVAQGLGPLVETSRPKSWGPATPASTRLGIPIQPTRHRALRCLWPDQSKKCSGAWFQGLFQDMTAGASFRHDHDKEQIRPERGLVYFPILRSLIKGENGLDK